MTALYPSQAHAVTSATREDCLFEVHYRCYPWLQYAYAHLLFLPTQSSITNLCTPFIKIRNIHAKIYAVPVTILSARLTYGIHDSICR